MHARRPQVLNTLHAVRALLTVPLSAAAASQLGFGANSCTTARCISSMCCCSTLGTAWLSPSAKQFAQRTLLTSPKTSLIFTCSIWQAAPHRRQHDRWQLMLTHNSACCAWQKCKHRHLVHYSLVYTTQARGPTGQEAYACLHACAFALRPALYAHRRVLRAVLPQQRRLQ
jgi:hypothetical protein